jgi:phage-related protein
MVALPAIEPSYGTQMAQDYRRKRIQMGDGYSVRARDGINSAAQQWTLTWQQIRNTDVETLRLFFEGLGGVDLIEWKPYNQLATLKWTASNFQMQPTGYNHSTCSITLTQEFDL